MSLSSVLLFSNSYSSSASMCRHNQSSTIKTGFEDVRLITPSSDNNHSILEDLLATNHCFKSTNNISFLGKSYIQYHKGTPSDRFSKIIEYPKDSGNKVLQFCIKHPSTDNIYNQKKGRVQFNTYNNIGVKHIVMSVRMYLHHDFSIVQSYPKSFNWLTISEWWNNAGWTDENYPFRISLNIIKERSMKSSPLIFKVSAQTLNNKRQWNKTIWESINRSFVIPIDRWMTLYFIVVEGDATNGQFIFSVKNHLGKKTTIFNINNYTHHPSDPSPDGFSHINPIKLYTSGRLIDFIRENGGVLQVYWDDLDITTNIIK